MSMKCWWGTTSCNHINQIFLANFSDAENIIVIAIDDSWSTMKTNDQKQQKILFVQQYFEIIQPISTNDLQLTRIRPTIP